MLKVSIQGKGNIYIKLHTKEAPKTTSQIQSLASQGFYDGQKVALHSFTRDVGACSAPLSGDLVDFIEKDNAALFCPVERLGNDFVHVDQLVELVLQ